MPVYPDVPEAYSIQAFAATNSLGIPCFMYDGTFVFIAKYGSASSNILAISGGSPSLTYSFGSLKSNTSIPGLS